MSRYDETYGGSRYQDNRRRDSQRRDSHNPNHAPRGSQQRNERYQSEPYRDSRQRDRQGGRPPKKRKGSAVGTFFSTLLLIVALGVFGYSAFTLYGYYKEYKAGTDEYGNLNDKYVTIVSDTESAIVVEGEEQEAAVLTSVEALEDPNTLADRLRNAKTQEVVENNESKTLPVLKNPINFTELHAINEDIMGWIRIGALDISYPVAQAEDNDYYLHRTFKREENFAGCIFLNCDNTKYLTDQNTIVYGHNMKNGSMFGKLKEFEKQETYDKNPYFWIFTPELIYQYRIFSCSFVNKMGDPYRTRFATEDFQNFINTCQSNSMIDNHGVEVTAQDRIMTLSTCTGDDSTRLILQGTLAQIYVAQ